MCSSSDVLGRRLRARLVFPLTLSLAGWLAAAQGQTTGATLTVGSSGGGTPTVGLPAGGFGVIPPPLPPRLSPAAGATLVPTLWDATLAALQQAPSLEALSPTDRPTTLPLNPYVPPAPRISAGSLILQPTTGGVVQFGTASTTWGNGVTMGTVNSMSVMSVVDAGDAVLIPTVPIGAVLTITTGVGTVVSPVVVLAGSSGLVKTGSGLTVVGGTTFTGATLFAGTPVLRSDVDPALLTISSSVVPGGTLLTASDPLIAQVTAVPEPGSAVLLLGGAALGLAARRRRRPHPESA